MQFGKQIVIASRRAQDFVRAIVVDQGGQKIRLRPLARACSFSRNVTGVLKVGLSPSIEKGFSRPSTDSHHSACQCPILAQRYRLFLTCSQRIDLCTGCWLVVVRSPPRR